MTSLPFLYNDFHGGLNTKDAPYLLTDDESRDLQNVQGTTAGAIVKRNGLLTFAEPAARLTSLYPLEATTSPFLIGAGGTSLYSISITGVVTAIKTGLTSNLKWEFVQSQIAGGQGPLYGMNGTDTPQQWSGSGSCADWTATTGTVPNGKYMTLAGNRIWVTGVAATPSRVFFSDLIPANNGPITWPTANVAIFDENDGAPITGIGHVGPYILVSKARKLYLITDFNTGDARRLSDTIGCISHRSIAEAPEGTYFLGEDRGAYLTNGSKVTPISDNIKPTTDAISAGERQNASGTYFDGHYYLSVNYNGVAGENDTVLDFDSALQSWWVHTFGSSQFAVWHPTGTAELFSAKGTGAIVDQCFVPNVTVDNGTPFTWRWRGPWQSPTFYRRRRFPTPYFRKRVRQIRFDGAGTVDFSLGRDFYGGEVLWQTNAFMPSSTTFGGAGNFGAADGTYFGDMAIIARARVYTLGVYSAISVVFSATSTTDDLVTSYVLMITDRKDLVVS